METNTRERRKALRTPLVSELFVKRLDTQEEQNIEIEVHDVSKTGVGFVSGVDLQIGSIYEANLRIWTSEVLHCFLEIVRKSEQPDGGNHYGSIFVGLTPTDEARIMSYQTVMEYGETFE